MAQATISETVVEPALAHIEYITLGSDLMDSTKMRVFCHVSLKRDDGSEFRRETVEVPLGAVAMTTLQSNVETVILPKVVTAIESLLGVTFV